jgi:hypothetical protein
MITCQECRHWGSSDGKGFHYDAGYMNYCNQPQMSGSQHPSYGACGEPTSMVCTGEQEQQLMTRWNFGCVLGETVFNILEKQNVQVD